MAETSAAGQPQSAQSYGKASIILSVIGIVITVIAIIICIVIYFVFFASVATSSTLDTNALDVSKS